MRERGVRHWLREPLIHFLALGALFFALHAWVGRADEVDSRPHIDISAEDIARLSDQWTGVWGRPASEGELRQMVEDQVRDEVLFREALAMELDQDDVVLRGRMVQKMEFLFEDVAALSEPTEAEMAALLAESPEQFRTPPRLSFAHVYFNPDQRGSTVEQDAKEALELLSIENPEHAPEAGDRFLRPLVFIDKSEADVRLLFGNGFAAELFALEASRWRGPLASSYGIHLVRVSGRVEGRVPELDEVRDRVRQNLEARRSREANERMYESMRERYQISIDEDALQRMAPTGTDSE